MQRLLLFADELSTWVGRACSWGIVALTLLISWEVFSRYALARPHAWAFDAMLMLYGTFFMMAGAYTLSQNGHVRGDVLYGFFSPRVQASLDLVLYVAFFLPGVVALTWAGYDYAAESWAIREHSSLSADGPPIYFFKAVIPAAGAILLLQGSAEILRCGICLRRGAWPARGRDVAEVDVEKLKQRVRPGADAERAR